MWRNGRRNGLKIQKSPILSDYLRLKADRDLHRQNEPFSENSRGTLRSENRRLNPDEMQAPRTRARALALRVASICNALLSFVPRLPGISGALHNALKMWICSQLLLVCAIDFVETLAERMLPLSAEAGILPQMGVRGIARYVRGLAREDHLRIPAKSRKKRFAPRKYPWQ
jgi:hypothetical protein